MLIKNADAERGNESKFNLLIFISNSC